MPADTSPHSNAGGNSGWRAERSCPICWSAFRPAGPRHRYCCGRCRKTAHTRRHHEPALEASKQAPSPAPVATRACPHCGEPVSVVALLTTPQAARPTIPEPGVIPLRRA